MPEEKKDSTRVCWVLDLTKQKDESLGVVITAPFIFIIFQHEFVYMSPF